MSRLYADLDSAVEVISALMARSEDAEQRLEALRGDVREQTLRLIQSVDPDERRIGWLLAVRFGMAKEVSVGD